MNFNLILSAISNLSCKFSCKKIYLITFQNFSEMVGKSTKKSKTALLQLILTSNYNKLNILIYNRLTNKRTRLKTIG